MPTALQQDSRLAERLILDELFDLSLYQALDRVTKGKLKSIFDQLIPIEKRHFAFWQEFFDHKVERLDRWRRAKLFLIVLLCRLFGERAVHLVLEAIEVYGVRKYLTTWEKYRDTSLGAAVRGILEDEFGHEDMLVTEAAGRQINPEGIRNIFLGFNDGLTEMLGAVSGFFAAFHEVRAILIASFTVTVAGAFSMAAGAYVATSSAAEVARTEDGKRKFLNQSVQAETSTSPLGAALVVGFSYFAGALVPILPVFLGARNIALSVVAGALFVVGISCILAFLSGMKITQRIATNLFIIALAVIVTYAIGTAVKAIFGISV
jgi:VIT1/CCC1 family predicted Fe2+/Mn2+ transporter